MAGVSSDRRGMQPHRDRQGGNPWRQAAAMVEITLPCCDTPASLEREADEVRCETCGIVHELAPDAREPRASQVELRAAA
jgi:hypothetical protein